MRAEYTPKHLTIYHATSVRTSMNTNKPVSSFLLYSSLAILLIQGHIGFICLKNLILNRVWFIANSNQVLVVFLFNVTGAL